MYLLEIRAPLQVFFDSGNPAKWKGMWFALWCPDVSLGCSLPLQVSWLHFTWAAHMLHLGSDVFSRDVIQLSHVLMICLPQNCSDQNQVG